MASPIAWFASPCGTPSSARACTPPPPRSARSCRRSRSAGGAPATPRPRSATKSARQKTSASPHGSCGTRAACTSGTRSGRRRTRPRTQSENSPTLPAAARAAVSFSRSQRHPRLPFGDVARDGRRGDGVGVGEIQLPRSRPAREVAIDRAYRHFVARLRYPGARVDAVPARSLEESRADLLEQLKVAPLFTIALHVLGAALDVEPHPRRDPRPPLRRLREHPCVHVHVFLLPRRAGARVRDIHADPLRRRTDILAVARIARQRHHRPDRARRELDHFAVLGVAVAGEPGAAPRRLAARHPTVLHQII